MHIFAGPEDARGAAGDSSGCGQKQARPSLGAAASGLVMETKVRRVLPKFKATELQPPTLDGASCVGDRAYADGGGGQSPTTGDPSLGRPKLSARPAPRRATRRARHPGEGCSPAQGSPERPLELRPHAAAPEPGHR